MKRTVIGSVFMLSGVIVTMGVIITAGLYVPSLKAWSGTKLWYAIFGAKQYGNEVVQSLFLGAPFVIGIILAVIGLIMLIVEYCGKEN